MRLICEECQRKKLELELLPYADLQVTLVQVGCEAKGVHITFDPTQLEELHEVLDLMMHRQRKTVMAQKDGRWYPILTNDIVYIEGYRREAYLHTLKHSYTISYRLYEAEALLEDEGFIRINKSMIANIRKIKCIMPALNSCYTLEMVNGVCLECSRQYWKMFKAKLERGD
ncbi:LytTR family DNA-binding domain-containing protein [[Eubacterium] hominis]|uniref:LytTR family DNA-binding domain-containing protein n=1 Tax=[Eubacterium] hominis TaxID=2764325 RepID=UPI003A4E37C0